MEHLNEKLEKNFDNSPVRLSMPILSIFRDKIIISTTLTFREKSPFGVVFDSVKLVGGFGRKYENNESKSYFAPKKLHSELVVTIDTSDKQPLMKDAEIRFCFLDYAGRKLLAVYQSDRAGKLMFLGMSYEKMSEEEKDLYMRCFQNDIQVNAKTEMKNEETEETENGETEYQFIPSLEKYREALRKEMYYLRNQGGRKYKVSSGKQVSVLHGRYYYSFELETELFLSDDAPLRLITGGREADGTVLVCEGFQIIVVIDKDFGEKIASAEISVEPWKLLEALQKKIAKLSCMNGIATRLVEEGPKLGKKRPYTEILKGQSNVKAHMKNNDITVVWGPPGTGKTYTMAQIAIDYLEQGKTVLVVSHSNISVDGVVVRVESILVHTGRKRFLEEGNVLRYGYVREENLAQNENVVSFNYALKNSKELKSRMDALLAEKEKLQKRDAPFDERRVEIEREIKAIRTSIREMERAKVNAAQMVATTISKVTVDPLFEEKQYDIVMFDEVSMAYVLQLVCAAMFAREHFLCVGDFMQLAPIAQSVEKRILEMDIFEYLHITDGTNVYAHPWLVMLDEQRRMYPDISAFSNKKVYRHLLIDHEDALKREDIIERNPLSGTAMNLIDMSGTCCVAYSNKDNSHFNILSAIVSFSTALTAEKNGEDSIGIITPYAAQARLIKAMIQDYRKQKETNIACVTVHQFQGSQRNLIVFDMVESFPFSKPGLLTSSMENHSVTRLVNVAVTRARGKLIAVANHSFWKRKLQDSNNLFYLLQKHMKENNHVISTEEKKLQQYVPELETGRNIWFYDVNAKLHDAMKDLQKDIENAEGRIIVSLPSGLLSEEVSYNILKMIKTAQSRGVQILMKCREYEALPDEWKDFCYQSTNAVFPVIAIDNKVIWYGLPLAQWSFKDGTTSFGTVYPMIYRIRGEHTVEIIHSLASLDMKEVDGKEKALLEKASANDESGIADAGFPEYAKKICKCPKCKSPMEVLRNSRKICYMRCSDRKQCKGMDYLREDIVNSYIWNEHVTCPKHRSEIYAKTGPYGIYVVCEKGGHFMKPDEI